ncbi:MAG TPA: hypothetical protein ENN76_03155 [Euryarchaeota archaeon]|nr:hypothetical protein [Euryarchaeota archaeon]
MNHPELNSTTLLKRNRMSQTHEFAAENGTSGRKTVRPQTCFGAVLVFLRSRNMKVKKSTPARVSKATPLATARVLICQGLDVGGTEDEERI